MFLAERCVWPYRYRHGGSPLLVSMPHVGTYIPPSMQGAFSVAAVARPDTDWHLPRLYDFLEALDATVIAATFSRYVVDVNRPPDGASLYPGRETPGLVPLESFQGEPLYCPGREPGPEEVERRLEAVWRPYHRRLRSELDRLRAAHGAALLWDAHSIVSRAPRLFEGRLADFNLGTGGGASCDPALARSLHGALAKESAVLDGRFKGGHITRHYGQPRQGVHAIQMEMAQSLYMDEHPPYTFDAGRAARVRPILRGLMERALDHVNRARASRV